MAEGPLDASGGASDRANGTAVGIGGTAVEVCDTAAGLGDEAATFWEVLRARAARDRKKRMSLETLWELFRGEIRGYTGDAGARAGLCQLVEKLVAMGLVFTPRSARLWDRSATPPLPFWVQLSADDPPVTAVDPRRVAWPPELSFAAGLGRSVVWLPELIAIKDFLAAGGRTRTLLPLRERSLELFGDEKRLDQLKESKLFKGGQLSFDLLRCYEVVPPLVWESPPAARVGESGGGAEGVASEPGRADPGGSGLRPAGGDGRSRCSRPKSRAERNRRLGQSDAQEPVRNPPSDISGWVLKGSSFPSTLSSLLIVENLHTYDSFRRQNAANPRYRAIGYGHGQQLIASIVDVLRLRAQLGISRVFYFGDLDRRGLMIARQAAQALLQCAHKEVGRGLAPLKLEPATHWYRLLLHRGELLELSRRDSSSDPLDPVDLAWLPESLHLSAKRALHGGHRLPQEAVTRELISDPDHWGAAPVA